jgi:hypothetical protein
LRTWGRKVGIEKPDHGAIRRLGLVVVTNDNPPVVLLGLESQEIYGTDILLFFCRYSESTGHQAIGFGFRAFKGDAAFDQVRGAGVNSKGRRYSRQIVSRFDLNQEAAKARRVWESSYERDPHVQPKHLDLACVNPGPRGFSGTRRGD